MSQRLFATYRVLWMDPLGSPTDSPAEGLTLCCSDMRNALTNTCEQHAGDAFACGDMLVTYSPTFDEYSLVVHDGGASSVLIKFCPWCGTRLPASRRDAWFDEVDAQGFDSASDTLPEHFKGATWRQSKR